MQESTTKTTTQSEGRARSLGRSRSRGRAGNPSELLARKQQLLSSSGHLSSGDSGWSSSPRADALGAEHQHRPQTRRAQQQQQLDQQRSSGHQAERPPSGGNDQDQQRAASVEARLESLSELLMNHQISQETAAAVTNGGGDMQSPSSAAKSIDDVYILLAKKEKDLQLAAELGKVLLERNDELSKANERITEDYSHKLELLEQDKHRLKRKLDQLDGEYENRLIELQTDCNILKNQLDEQQQLARQTEKEKSKLIDDLVQQNQRLTSELVEATKSEELLSSQLEQMNERFNVRMSNRQDHVVQLDALKEEIQIVNQRKQDLERRLKLANNDKSSLSAALDESGDKILLLENLLNEKDAKLAELMEETNELRDASSWLSNELESMINLNEKLATCAEGGGNENDNKQQAAATTLDELGGISQRKRSQLVEQLKELRLKMRSRLKANEFLLYNRRAKGQSMATTTTTTTPAGRRVIRRQTKRRRQTGDAGSLLDELEHESSGNNSGSPASNGSGSPDNVGEDDDGDDDEYEDGDEEDGNGDGLGGRRRRRHEWKEEIAVEIYTLLRRFHMALQLRKDAFLSHQTAQHYHHHQTSTAGGQASAQQLLYSPNSAEDSGISGDDIDKVAGQEKAQAKDPATWKRLLTSLKSLIEEMPCSSCQLMIGERADYEQLQKAHAKLCDELRRKNDELLALQATKLEHEAKLANLEQRCALLSEDLSNCDKPKEEIVKLAWKARDEAVERKNGAEISLAKTRIENMQIASQLMEVVQQKGELSQKLAQFEDDIHYITQDSVKAKFTWEEHAEQLRRSNRPTQPDSTNYSSNPLAQLLSFSSAAVASSRDTNGASKSSAMVDNLVQPASLMRNFIQPNRFNLRFWQRSSSSSEKSTGTPPPDKGSTVGNNNNTTTTAATTNTEQKVA